MAEGASGTEPSVDPVLRGRVPDTPSTDDWPLQATDAIVRTVDRVREQTTGRAIVIATGAVYGLVIAVAATIIGIIAVIGWFRLSERAFARIAEAMGMENPEPMWAVYLFYGAIFTLLGLLFWRKRKGALEGGRSSTHSRMTR